MIFPIRVSLFPVTKRGYTHYSHW